MRLNENTLIEGQQVYLIPYRKEHVLKYHEWMKSPELQVLTASEPLSLEEEFQMQESWRDDNDKCTFIILCKEKYDETKNDIESMIGDTNIFLKNEDDRDVAEVEVMIAEPSARGKGLGKEALLIMLQYGILKLKIETYKAVILETNTKSIALFKSIGFEKVGENKVFNEIVFEKKVSDVWINYMKNAILKYTEKSGDGKNLLEEVSAEE